MENMTALRTAYGSGPLEEFNPLLYPYRRNVAASITLTLFAVRSALVTKLPLPQFLPSARVAHLRMVNKVRAVVIDAVRHNDARREGDGGENQNSCADADADADEKVGHGEEEEMQNIVTEKEEDEAWISQQARRRAVRKKYLSWNAASAAQAEIIEFLEELVELAKLIVGANEFRSGVLARRRVFGGSHLRGGGYDAGGGAGGSGDGGGGGNKADGLVRRDINGKMATAQTKDGAHVPRDGNADGDRDRFANIIDAAAPSPSGQHPVHLSTTRKGKRRGNTVTSVGSVASGASTAEGHPAAASAAVGAGGGHVPVSLMRIQSRKREAAELKRVGTGDGGEGTGKGKGIGRGGVEGEGV